jgi:hypothetical protein
MSDNRSTQRPLQLFVWVGASAAPALPAAKTAQVLPGTCGAQDVVEAVRAAGITPADLRSNVLVGFDAAVDVVTAMAVYVAMTALAARRLDAMCGPRTAALSDLDAKLRKLPEPQRPTDPPECVQIGADHPDIPVVTLDGPDAPEALVAVRHARRVRLVPSQDVLGSLTTLVAVSALRARPGFERLPMLVRAADAGSGDHQGAGFDLDTVRAGAFELRRSLRTENSTALAPRVALTARLARLVAAAAVPVEETLAALGSHSPDGTLWHCPRPDRHRNGDANASVRVDAGTVRCFRCDAEHVDSLRLAASVRGCSLDDAADWLLTGATTDK